MAYSVEYDSVENMIMAKVSGEVNQSDLREFGLSIIRMVKRENCCYVLTDLREAQLNVSVMEMFNLPNDLKEMSTAQDVNIYVVQRAFVALKTQKDLDFYEIVSQNRGLHTKLFHELEEAKAWLKNKSQDPPPFHLD